MYTVPIYPRLFLKVSKATCTIRISTYIFRNIHRRVYSISYQLWKKKERISIASFVSHVKDEQKRENPATERSKRLKARQKRAELIPGATLIVRFLAAWRQTLVAYASSASRSQCIPRFRDRPASSVCTRESKILLRL